MTLLQHLHWRFTNFASRLPQEVFPIARSLFIATTKKTRYCSHISFLRQCLQSKVTPKGFQLNYHRGSTLFNTTRQRISASIKQCSTRLMKSNLAEYTQKVSDLTSERTEQKTNLQMKCDPTSYSKISRLLHILNQEYYHSLKSTKDRKFQSLLAERPVSKPPDYTKTVVTIPEDVPLTEAEKSVLSKGLKYIPTRQKTDKFTVGQDLEAFFRRIKLHAHFQDPNKTISIAQDQTLTAIEDPLSKYAPKSTWSPPDDQQSAVTRYVNACRSQLPDLSTLPHSRNNNLKPDEREALKSLRNRSDIVIKPADKGGAVVVWKKELYLAEVNKQLSNSEFYSNLPHDTTNDNNEVIRDTIRKEITDGNLPKEAERLIIDKPRSGRFYVVPKIHKEGFPGRPIVSACNCPSERISSFVDDILQPLVQTLPSFTRDSTHAISKIKDIRLSGDNPVLLFTMDVKSLYTVIPHQDGLMALKHFLNQREVQDPPTHTVVRLAELVLTTNTFSANGEYYQQVKGVAMGTKMGPSYANLFMGWLEQQMDRTYHNTLPDLYMRYIDDIFGITTMPRAQLDEWMNHLKSLHPAVQYTSTISETQVSFLDTTVKTAQGEITTTIHYKETDSHNFLRYNSFHPKKTKDAIPYSQMLRLRRIISDNEEFTSRKDEMLGFFRQRDFPESVLQSAEKKILRTTQETALQPSTRDSLQRIPFVTTYHPSIQKVFHVLKSNWSILTSDVSTASIFPSPPLLSTRRNRNLRDILVHSSTEQDAELAGTFPCKRRRCFTCEHTSNVQTLVGPKSSWTVRSSYTCTTRNLIYCITCTSCGKLYIGETKRMLAERFREHLRDIKKKSVTSPVAQHFNLSGHSIDDIQVSVLRECTSDSERKATEMRIIDKMGTLDPHGLNIEFTFNV